jgi:membrane fusion protein, multidrug efflux system
MRALAVVFLIILGLVAYKFLGKKPDESEGKPSGAPSGQQGGGGKKDGGKPMPVDVYIAKISTSNQSAQASGTLVPYEEVDLKSEMAGRIVKLNISEGSEVAKGQLIAKINDADILARLKKLKYEDELAKQTEARQKKLLDINAISREEYEISTTKINTLSADKEALEVELAKTEIRSPFSGRIGLKNISGGAYVTPGSSIATIVQINPIKLDFSLPEKYYSKVRKNGKVTISIEGSNLKKEGTIIAIDPKIDEALRTVKIRASLQNADKKLMPGMFTKVDLSLGNNQAIFIPTEAVIPFVGGKKVLVIKEGKAKEVSIITGLRNENQVEVIQGISLGDSIVASGLINLKPDQAVKMKKLLN